MPANRPYLMDLAALVLAVDLALLGASAMLLLSPPVLDETADIRAVAAYQAYAKSLAAFHPGPAECRSESDLNELESALMGTLAPPAEYARRWDDTAAVKLYRKWFEDLKIIRRLTRELADRNDDWTSRGERLLVEPDFNLGWAERAMNLLSQVPVDSTGFVPGSVTLRMPRGKALTFATINELDLVHRAILDRKATARRLTGLPDFLDFLGTIGRRINSLPLALAVLYR